MQAEIVQTAILNAFEDHIARIIDEDIEPAVAFFDRFHHFDPLIFLRDIKRHRIAANIACDCMGKLNLAVGYHDRCALLRQPLAIGFAQSHCAACDKSDFALYAACSIGCHSSSPKVCVWPTA